MKLDRRDVLAGGGALLASCASGAAAGGERAAPLDALLAAHAGVLPERAGAGANHYPMAAEALETLGRADRIEEAWRRGAAGYAGAPPRVAPVTEADFSAALGDYGRYGDWLDLFRAELAREPWRSVVARWTPRLAPGASAAVFHGLIRTAHAARALRRGETRERRDELAVALAYWAARYAELSSTADIGLDARLSELPHPWLDELEDVPFDAVHARLARAPIAPRVALGDSAAGAREDLAALASEAAAALLEMLALERHRLWLLHGVTGPSAAALLVPELDERDARALAAYTRQAVVALHVAFGAPHEPGAHLRDATPPWPELVRRAAESGSVHTIKLVETLDRELPPGRLRDSVAAHWLEWR